MEYWGVGIEFAKILLSWPTVTVTIVIFVSVYFYDQLSSMFERISSLKLPGTELSLSQQILDEAKPSEGPKALPNPPLPDPPMQPGLILDDNLVSQLRSAWNQEKQACILWEYRYLNWFLVFNTQKILDWAIRINTATSIDNYNAVWSPLVPVSNQRIAILSALESHSLIAINGDFILVTDKGKDYAAWPERRLRQGDVTFFDP